LLPGGVAVQATVVLELGRFVHCRIVAAVGVPIGKPVRLLVTVTVQLTVLAGERPALLH